jgi:anaphase-promoting complex subunit 10
MKVEVESEIGKHAVWSLSTAKQGSGVQQLRDNSIDTFWQYIL